MKDVNFILVEILDNDEYCLNCYQDIYESWLYSVYCFSFFNNFVYFVSVVELWEELLECDGDVWVLRWCVGCYDLVFFFSGKFDDLEFDVFKDFIVYVGIICMICYVIMNVNSFMGNVDYIIEEFIYYFFVFSDQLILKWINLQLIKVKLFFYKWVMFKFFY